MHTRRLTLRRWDPEDRGPFALLNADPAVMRHIGGPANRTESDALIDHFEDHWERWGFGVFAIKELDSGLLVGFVGLNHHRLFPDDVEIGWRLRYDSWGAGLATEGAMAVVDWAFRDLRLTRLLAITSPANAASLRVMQKIGMRPWRDIEPDGKVRRVFELTTSDLSSVPSVPRDIA